MINNILISRELRKELHHDTKFIGMEGENLQEVLVFQLDEDIEGTGIIEIQFPDSTTGFIETEKTERGYELPVKSSLLKQSGFVRFQLRILQNNQEVFKSEIIRLEVRESINATATIPEEYPCWVDSLEKLKQNLETAENERIAAENARIASETSRQSAETARSNAETERDTNETNRISQESTRQSAETKRVSAENIRAEKEVQRQTAEDARVSNEQQRQNNETTREANELNRVQAESERVQAETSRANAERTRVETFSKMKQATEEAVKEIEDKKEDYNRNAAEKVKEYNQNVTAQTKAFNDNVTAKTTEFNQNVETQTNAYNQNTETKLNEYDQHAKEKINEYNANSEELKNRVVELELENTRLREDINNSTTNIADKGENLTLKNTVEARFKKFRIGGNSWQKTREGYNLAKLDVQTYENGGIVVTNNGDGSFTLNGTSTSNVDLSFTQNTDLEVSIYTFENAKYLLKTFVESGSIEIPANIGVQVALCGKSNGAKDYELLFNRLHSPQLFAKVKDMSDNQYLARIQMYVGGAGVVFKNYKIRILFAKSSDENLPYEQYGAMPSPEFRSDIKNCGDNVNLYDKDNPNILDTAVDSKGLGSNSPNSYKTIYVKCEPNTTYTVSKKYDEIRNRFSLSYSEEEPTYNMQVQGLIFSETKSELTITTGENAKYLLAYVWINAGATTYQEMLDSIKIGKGAKATPWSPYNCGNVNITVCNENLYPRKLDWVQNLQTQTLRGYYFAKIYVGKNKTIAVSYDDDVSPTTNAYLVVTNQLNDYGSSFGWLNHPTEGKKSVTVISNEEGDIYLARYEEMIVSKIQIEEGEATDYEQHQEQSFSFPLDKGQKLMKGDYLADDGIHHKRKQIVLNGSENWIVNNTTLDGYYAWHILNSFYNIKGNTENILCNKLPSGIWGVSPYEEESFQSATQVTVLILKQDRVTEHTVTSLEEYLTDQYAKGTPFVLEYELEKEEIEPYTEEQKRVYDKIQKTIKSYKGTTHIFCTNETSLIFDVEATKDQQAENDKLQAQIDEIKQLLSTTATSAMLLDNMQSELESEV